jgi:hypothetical protein
MLASKAVYLASLIKGENSLFVLETTASRPKTAVKAAVASGLRNLSEQNVDRVSNLLIDGRDGGVRKITNQFLNFGHPICLQK